ncbi:MAG: hypothetical protein U5J98_08000 [Halobacteriales archaeon]|nr:hypothetical protein [Halobacteriales archaeon]
MSTTTPYSSSSVWSSVLMTSSGVRLADLPAVDQRVAEVVDEVARAA